MGYDKQHFRDGNVLHADQLNCMEDAICELMENQNNTKGEDGATFTPTVSSAGVLSWSNDGNLPNPAPVNIKGPQGPAPLKGVDYFTEADKQEIVDDVLAAIPVAEGSSF